MKLNIEDLKCLQSRIYAATLGGLSLEDGKKATSAIAELIVIRELKGEQVPVAWRYRTTDLNGNPNQGWAFSDEDSLLGLYQPLYDRPQKPVVPVGFLFVVKATGAVIYSIADAAIEGTQLIGQIYGDAAIEAAGGIVKDGE